MRNQWIYATDAQVHYLRILLKEAFSRRIEGFYIRDWERLLKSDASRMISELKQKLGK